jgi:hypothetical protein
VPSPDMTPEAPYAHQLKMLRETFGVVLNVEGDTVTLSREEVFRERNYSVKTLMNGFIAEIQQHYKIVYAD